MRVVAYPFGVPDAYLARQWPHMVLSANKIIPVSCQAPSHSGKDASRLDGGSACGVAVRDDLNDAVDEGDLVLFRPMRRGSVVPLRYNDSIARSLALGKRVVVPDECLPSLDNKLRKVDALCTYSDLGAAHRSAAGLVRNWGEHRPLNTRVVLFASLSQYVDPIEVLVRTMLAAATTDVHALAVCQNEDAVLFGMPRIGSAGPSEGNIVVANVLQIREDIRRRSFESDAKVVFVGISAPLLQLHPLVPGDLGLSAVAIASVLQPDGVLLLVHRDFDDDESQRQLATLVKGRLGCDVLAFVITRAALCMSEVYESRKESVVFDEEGLTLPDEMSYPVFDYSVSNLGERILEVLV